MKRKKLQAAFKEAGETARMYANGAKNFATFVAMAPIALLEEKLDRSWEAALSKGDAKLAAHHLEKRPTLANTPIDENGTSPLLYTVTRNFKKNEKDDGSHYELARVLLQYGARQDVPHVDADTLIPLDPPLLHAAKEQDHAMMALLLKHDTQHVNTPDYYGRKALDYATGEDNGKFPSVICTRLLLEHGALPNDNVKKARSQKAQMPDGPVF
ncbi:MAG: hypothetical protein OXT65_00400 [Alphaproteobacteria bacterium]|nr:hypothetical protein [Alphaproteobacteria bacterium]